MSKKESKQVKSNQIEYNKEGELIEKYESDEKRIKRINRRIKFNPELGKHLDIF